MIQISKYLIQSINFIDFPSMIWGVWLLFLHEFGQPYLLKALLIIHTTLKITQIAVELCGTLEIWTVSFTHFIFEHIIHCWENDEDYKRRKNKVNIILKREKNKAFWPFLTELSINLKLGLGMKICDFQVYRRHKNTVCWKEFWAPQQI